MIWRISMLTMQLGLLMMAGLAILRGPLSAPIFGREQGMLVPEANAPEMTGGGGSTEMPMSNWQPRKFGTLFEAKEYHLSIARDWLAAAGVAEPPTDAEYSERAAEHARKALMEGPANGYAWTFLAWAEYLAGHEDKAQTALAMSWRWTPNSSNIALSRAILASRWWPILVPADRERVLIDLIAAYARDKKSVRAAIDADKRLKTIWRLARDYRSRVRAIVEDAAEN